MRIKLLIIALLSSVITFGQVPVKWQITAGKVTDTLYELQVKGTLEKGWYVYAENVADEGLETVQLKWDNNQVQKEKTHYTTVAAYINDPVFENKRFKVFENSIAFSQFVKFTGPVPASLTITITGFTSNGKEFLPIEEKREVPFGGTAEKISDIKLRSIDLARPVSTCGEQQNNANKSLLTIFLLGVAGGLLALLTPCVFPMIPVTVSYFTGVGKTKKQGIRNGIIYGLSILFIYLVASVPFHLIGNINPQVFNSISTNAWVNIFFFAIFIFFALSFFGVFNIQLPSSIANTAGNKGGIFFMALTLAIVSFSCTGPILGSLLVGSLSSEGGAWQLTAGMAGFGVALALPFALFAMFPNWLKTLPKSGGWMETVKVSLAFVELALAVKFLSNADLVKHWGILKREVFIGLWLLIALSLSIYLLKPFIQSFNKFVILYWKTAIPVAAARKLFKSAANGRFVAGIIVLVFAVYLVPGVTRSKGANLTLLSGFPPPLGYSIYGKENIQGKGVEPDVVNDYDKALQLSRTQNKPMLIDFTGWACVNCRKMEEHVWSKPEITKIIKEHFILVSLYVDDRKNLPPDQQYTFKGKNGEKYIKTIGDKWAIFQQENFGQVTQPLYVILSPEEKLMNNPVGYTPASEEYKIWLECGIDAYNKQKEIALK